MADLTLQNTPPPLNLTPLIPVSPPALVVVVLYFAADVEITPFSTPALFISPVRWPMNTNKEFSNISTKFNGNRAGMAKLVRFLLTVQVLGEKPRLPFQAEDFQQIKRRVWQFWNETSKTWHPYEPYPTGDFQLRPQYVLMMMPFERETYGSEAKAMVKEYSFFEGFFTEAKPVVFVLYYSKTGGLLKSDSKPSETPSFHEESKTKSNFVGYLLNWYCRFRNEDVELTEILGYRILSYSLSWFSCRSSSNDNNCWKTLEDTLKTACADGRLTVWALQNWPDRPWTLPLDSSLEFTELIFPVINASDGFRERLELGGDPRPDHRHFIEFSVDTVNALQPVVFVTAEDLFTEGSGFEMYVQLFDRFTWSAILIAVLICSMVLAIATRRFRNFPKAVSDLAASGIDQMSTIGATNSRILLTTWLLAVWVLNNWYKAEIKSSFAFSFPYETKLKSWRDFENFSLYSIYGANDQCRQRFFEFAVPTTQYNLDLNDVLEYTKREATDNKPGFWTVENETMAIYHGHHAVGLRNGFQVIPKSSELRWLHSLIDTAEDCYTSKRKSQEAKEICGNDLERLRTMNSRWDFICLDEFGHFIGEPYRRKIAEARQVLKLPLSEWNLTATYYDEVEVAWTDLIKSNSTRDRTPTDETYRLLYWMSRKYKSAFVFSQGAFPYYWNLFKQLMQNSSTLRFAHTRVSYPKDKFGYYVPQMSSLPQIEINGYPLTYPPPVKYMLNRMKALTTSGLVDWLQRWSRALRPPREYNRSEEISESSTGARPMMLQDSTFLTILTMWGVGIGFSLTAVVMELLGTLMT